MSNPKTAILPERIIDISIMDSNIYMKFICDLKEFKFLCRIEERRGKRREDVVKMQRFGREEGLEEIPLACGSRSDKF